MNASSHTTPCIKASQSLRTDLSLVCLHCNKYTCSCIFTVNGHHSSVYLIVRRTFNNRVQDAPFDFASAGFWSFLCRRQDDLQWHGRPLPFKVVRSNSSWYTQLGSRVRQSFEVWNRGSSIELFLSKPGSKHNRTTRSWHKVMCTMLPSYFDYRTELSMGC